MADKKTTDVVFVLDCSGSMMSCKQAAIDAFNEHVDLIRKNASLPNVGDIYVTLIEFNSDVRVVYQRASIDLLAKLTDKDYNPSNSTAWLNGLHTGMTLMDALPDANDPQHAYLVLSFTDGWENASQHRKPHASWEMIAAMVKARQDTNRWTFSVIGANVDLADVQQRAGFFAGNTISYAATPAGTKRASRVSNQAMGNYFLNRTRDVTASASYLSDVTGGATHVDEVKDDPAYLPTNPPQPAPQPAASGPVEGQMRGGATTGAPSPLLGGTD